ncbi:hypothetical protein [Sodalis sp. RH16]|uniref:hypothetical protein n=1 Tax=Sodalis sp. RH16 TaxID=3394331 RepID=UPI0039B390FB
MLKGDRGNGVEAAIVGRGAPHATVSPLSPKLNADLLKGDRGNGVEAAIVGRGAPHATVGPLPPKLKANLLKGEQQLRPPAT